MRLKFSIKEQWKEMKKKNQRRNLKAIAKEITPQEFLIHWCAGTLLKPNLAFNLTYESLMDFECKVM